MALEQMMLRTSMAPDEGGMIPPPESSMEALVEMAIRRYLQGGATVTKDAPLKGKAYRQYALSATRSVFIQQATDILSLDPPQLEMMDSYVVILCPETQGCRFTFDGAGPTATYGIPLMPNQIYPLPLQEIKDLQVCGMAAGCLLNVMYCGIDA